MLSHPSKKEKESKDRFRQKLIYNRFKPAQEGLREALCTLGNGYLTTRGAAAESATSRVHYPGVYMAGVYNKVPTNIAGRTISNEDFVNCPNWVYLTFRMEDGEWITPRSSRIISYHQELDMERGVFARKIHFKDSKKREVEVHEQRIVHMANPHIVALRYTIKPKNYQGIITVRSALDGMVQNTGVSRYRQLNSKHLKLPRLGIFGKNGVYLLVQTSQSKIRIAQAAKVNIFTAGKELKFSSISIGKRKKRIFQEFKLSTRDRQQYEIEKIVAIYTSRDKGVDDPLGQAINLAKKTPAFSVLLKTQKASWEQIWKKFDICPADDSFSQKVLKLHAFHLLQIATVHNLDIDTGFPARGLHGEAYRGHIFWDELFVMSFFDTYNPKISKALLLYRYRRLDKAREYAQKNNYQGAMFPWQSGSTGEEETQLMHLNPISGKWGLDYSRIQRHVSFAIAYNTWQHYKRTGDSEFLSKFGAEIILSVAKFGASLARYDSQDKRYHTEGLMGPDEFHERFPGAQKPGFRDNAYTNLLIVWTLLKAKETLRLLSDDQREYLIKKVNLSDEDFKLWDDIVRKMNIVINDQGIISQFDGYFKLKELNWQAYKIKYGNIRRLDRILKAEGKSPNDYKVAKQADVLMIFYLFSFKQAKELFNMLGYKLNKDMLKRNYDYYIRRTSHGSTLSEVVHCYIAHILGRPKEAWQRFQDVLKSDIYDIQGGTTAEGIHAGVMGGSLDIVMRGFTGLTVSEDMIKIDPELPRSWENLKLKLPYKGSVVSLLVAKDYISIFVDRCKTNLDKIAVKIQGKQYLFLTERTYKIFLKKY